MNAELLSKPEKIQTFPQDVVVATSNFDESQIQAAIAPRKTLLESIKPEITLKSYYATEERILAAEKRLKDILDIKRGRQNRLTKYSFILNPSYFDQEFLNI